MLAAITGFLSSLPQILSMIQSFMTWINKMSGNDPAGFAVKMGAAFNQLSAAQTQQEHADAAKALADLISGSPAK